MSTTAEKEQGFVPRSISYQKVLEEAEDKPCETFDQYPIDEVRRACIYSLDHDFRDHRPDRYYENWVEKRIIALEYDDCRDFWISLLRWYLFKAKSNETFNRALEFAIGLAEREPQYLSQISKEVTGVLARDTYGRDRQSYWLPSVRGFLKTLLAEIYPGKSGYSDSEWHCAARALRLIVLRKDITFLPEIEELAARYERGEIKTRTSRDDPFYESQRLSMLEQTVKLLQEARVNQFAGLSSTLGAYLKERAGLTGDLIIHLKCPGPSFQP